MRTRVAGLALLGLNIVGTVVVMASPATAGAARAADHQPRAALRVGTMELRRCDHSAAYCGRLERPFDPAGDVPGRITIYFEYYPHTAPGRSLGTLVATEGGPGYPATGSRDEYLALFKPLRQHRDVLLMDNRGTGRSGAVDCHDLQTAEKWTVPLTAACGASLGASAPLYSTAYAADDLAAILDALDIRRIDLYGDSYGTYFEQVFAVRHPDVLRCIVLDGAYPLNGPDYAWYPTYAPAMRDKFDIACRRFAPCAEIPGTSIDHIQPLLDELRAHPFTAQAADSDGKQRSFTADASQLATVMYAGAPALATVRETDAAARAFAAGDRAPLLRLMAETISAVDSRDPAADPTQWSAGLAAAVMCQDPPQIFDMRLAPALRIADRDRAVAERRRTAPGTYGPFTIDEYRGMPLDYSFIDQCVEWPVAPSGHPASHVVGADARYPDIPALIISGELDNITTMADGAAVAAAFKRGVQIRIANSFHVNALPHARSACGAQIVVRFMATLRTGDTACAAGVPPLPLVPRFAVRAAQLVPAVASAGNRASTAQLQWVSSAVMAVGDVLTRVRSNAGGHGVGLRGGTFVVANTPASVHVTLHQVKWTEDVAVSGSIDTPAARSGMVHATLRLRAGNAPTSNAPTGNAPAGNAPAGDAPTGELTMHWPQGVADSSAAIRGSLDGVAVVARMPAP